MNIDNSKCLAPRCYKKGNFNQCTSNPKPNSVFCGRHKNSIYRLDNNNFHSGDIKQTDIVSMDTFANSSNIVMCISKKNTNSKKPHVNKFLKMTDLTNIRKTYVKDLKFTLISLNLSFVGNKRELYTRLENYYKSMSYYKNNEDKLVIIQRVIKNKLFRMRNKYKGIGYHNKTLCNNQSDFYTLTDINEIPDKYFFSYKDEDNFVYAFDIRSFKKLVDNDGRNPYSRKDIPVYATTIMKKRINQMVKHNISLEDDEEEISLTPKQKLNMTVMTVFQKIDDLDTAAGGTDINWFINLSITYLKFYYKELEDIWNYRAELTYETKQRIVPNNNVFKKTVNDIYNIYNIDKIRYFILEEIDKLVSNGITEDDRKLGALWVLTALTMVSPDCASSLPWLIQV